MARITLPTPETGNQAGIPFTGLLGGIQFVDGVADAEIGPSLHAYFHWQGATIDTVEQPAPEPEPDEVPAPADPPADQKPAKRKPAPAATE